MSWYIATRHPVSKAVWMDFERAIRIAQKKPANPNYVDAIQRMPAVEDSSDEGSSAEDSDGYADEGEHEVFDPAAAMKEAMQTDTSSDEDAYSMLTKPAVRDKRRAPSSPDTPNPTLDKCYVLLFLKC